MFAISIFALCVSASVCFTDELHFRCTEDQSIRQGPHYPEPAIFHTVSLEGGVEGGGRWGHWFHLYLYLGFYFFIYTYLRVHFYLHLYLYFSLYVYLYTCAGHLYNSKSPPAS